MDWADFVDAARAVDWVTYVGTADGAGVPHVAAVAPGFADGSVWFATRRSSRKARNLTENRQVAFHWPVGSGGLGEVAAWGTAKLHTDPQEIRRVWDSDVFGYDLSQFFGAPDNPDLVFVEVAVEHARLVGPGFEVSRYRAG